MEKITKERVTTYDMYKAVDGTEFTVKEECAIYEETAKCNLLTKYNKLVSCQTDEYELFTENEDLIVDIVPINDKSTIDIIIQLYKLFNPTQKLDYFNKLRSKLESLSLPDTLLIGRGSTYDGCDGFYILTSLQELIKKVNIHETN